MILVLPVMKPSSSGRKWNQKGPMPAFSNGLQPLCSRSAPAEDGRSIPRKSRPASFGSEIIHFYLNFFRCRSRSPIVDPPAADEMPPPAHDHIGSSSSSSDEETPRRGSSLSAKRPDVEGSVVLLPPDYEEMLLRMVAPVGSATKEEIYRLLGESVLIDECKKSFALETSTGKKCYMLSARDLDIEWGRDGRYWGWTSLPCSRFPEVAVLLEVWWFEVTGRIDARELSPGTTYVAYLVFATNEQPEGLSDGQDACIKVGRDEYKCRVCLAPHSSETREDDVVIKLPRRRDDGWMEMELGEFFVDHWSQQVVQMQVMDVDTKRRKEGLIIEGMEVRPKRS